jgi:hypothetical protein
MSLAIFMSATATVLSVPDAATSGSWARGASDVRSGVKRMPVMSAGEVGGGSKLCVDDEARSTCKRGEAVLSTDKGQLRVLLEIN